MTFPIAGSFLLLSIRARLLTSFSVLAISTLIVGFIAWYWVTKSDALLDDLHRAALLQVSESRDLTVQSTKLTTSAPFLLNLKTAYLLESEASELLASIESAIRSWQDDETRLEQHGRHAREITDILHALHGSVVALVEGARQLAISEDWMRSLTQQFNQIEILLAATIENPSNPRQRDGIRRAQLALGHLIMAAHADSFLSIGEYRRRFYRFSEFPDLQQLPVSMTKTPAQLAALADGEQGLFLTQYRILQLKLESQRALTRVRSEAARLNASISEFISNAEFDISRRRLETSGQLANARILIAISALASIILALLSAHYVSRYVTANINSIADAMTKLAAGDHNPALPKPNRTGDEIGKLFDAFRVFRANAIRLRRSNSQLRRKTALFQSIFNNINDGIAITDSNGRLIEFNQRLEIHFRFLIRPLKSNGAAHLRIFLRVA